MLRNSLIREMSFKANFLLWMLVEVLWFVGQIVFFSIIFGNVDRIGDWTKWEVVLLIGTHQMISQLFQAFFFTNVAAVPELVRTGKLDSLLVLPVDSQFAVSTKQFGLDSVVNAVVGGVVVGVALSKLGYVPSPTSILLYIIAIGFGIAVHYSIMLSLAAVSFWIVRAQGLVYGYFNFLNIAGYRPLRADDPKTDRGQAEHDRIMHRNAEPDRNDVKQDRHRTGDVAEFGERDTDNHSADYGVDDAVETELFGRNGELTVDRQNEKRVEFSGAD